MSHFRLALLAAAASLAAGAAVAAPVVLDPNFNLTPTTAADSFYGIAAWGAAGLPAGAPNYNPSYAGNIGFDVFNQWNNGTPGNGETKVGFLANSTQENHAYIFQAVSGFVPGDIYTITVLANARVKSDPQGEPVVLQIATSMNGTVFSTTLTPVDVASVSTTPFTNVASNPFTAPAGTITITLSNQGNLRSSLLLSGLAINDVGKDPAFVPEPLSLALLASGLAGIALFRRRR